MSNYTKCDACQAQSDSIFGVGSWSRLTRNQPSNTSLAAQGNPPLDLCPECTRSVMHHIRKLQEMAEHA